MLSRRELLLVQPWEERRFRDHRSKVLSALPAIDARAPAPRPHVAVKGARARRERERTARVAADNFRLLQRLAALMHTNRLDNHWTKPPHNFQHKVGRYVGSSRQSARRPPPPDTPAPPVRCFACHTKKMQHYKRGAPRAGEQCLPSIH